MPTTTRSLLSLLDDWRASSPDAIVVTGYNVQKARSDRAPVPRSTVTTSQLWDLVIGAAASLSDMGIGRGDVVAIQLPTWHEYVAAHLAAYAAGAVTMPISPVYREREVARQLELSSARVLIVPAEYGSFDYLEMADSLCSKLDTLEHVVSVGGSGGHHKTWQELVARGLALPVAKDVARGVFAPADDEFALLNFTSGTTGVPKGVMHSVATLSAAVQAAGDRMEIGADDVILIAVTIGHAAGFLNGMYMPLLRRARAVYMDSWDPESALQIIERERVSYGPMMPTFLYDLVRHPRFMKADVSSLTRARVSGGAISRPVMAMLQERLPHLKLLPGWGMSEASYLTCGSPRDSLEKLSGTDGRPLNHAAIEIRDASFTRSVPQGESGEIVVRASSVMLGYFRQEALTKAAFTEDGMLKTGDIGRIDEEGYLVMVGRSKELVIRGGENVPVVEVENLLMEHPKVAGAAVIGVPDARLGEKVCAVIQAAHANEQLTFEEMQEHLLQRQLTRQFIPEYIVHVANIPRTALGKIRKQELRKEVFAVLDCDQQF